MLRLNWLVVRRRAAREFLLVIHGTIRKGGWTPMISRKDLEHVAKVYGRERTDRVKQSVAFIRQSISLG